MTSAKDLSARFYQDGRHAVIHVSGLVPAPAHVLEALELDPEITTSVIRRERTTYDSNNKKHSWSVSWFSADLAEMCPALLDTERIVQGTIAYITEQTGRISLPTHVVRAQAVFASPQVRERLDVETGTQVMRTRHWYWDNEEFPMEYGESVTVPNTEVVFRVCNR